MYHYTTLHLLYIWGDHTPCTLCTITQPSTFYTYWETTHLAPHVRTITQPSTFYTYWETTHLAPHVPLHNPPPSIHIGRPHTLHLMYPPSTGVFSLLTGCAFLRLLMALGVCWIVFSMVTSIGRAYTLHLVDKKTKIQWLSGNSK